MRDDSIYQILITGGDAPEEIFTIGGLPKLFTDSGEAAAFCEDLNIVAREESADWRYVPAILTQAEINVLQAYLMRDMF